MTQEELLTAILEELKILNEFNYGKYTGNYEEISKKENRFKR